MRLNSKAKTLEKLRLVVKDSKVLPVFRFFANEYAENKDYILKQIKSKFDQNIIVRSSSVNEDNFETSNAGGFDSVLSVDIGSGKDIDKAIQQVIHSYGDLANNIENEVFIQSMLTDVSISGVVFTADIDTLSPYYIINYNETGDTSCVTSGENNNSKTFVSFKKGCAIENESFKKIIKAAKECEYIFNNKFLDIEFAFSNNQLYILQVRAIVTNNKEDLSNVDLSRSLHKLHNKIKKLNVSHPNLLGDKTIFGVMPDWNPAEIIGIRPKRLALSLYKELITDETWAYQRDNYGYRNLRSHPLLVSFLGVPYIDVRISFNSFVPKSLSDEIAKKLVNYCLNELAQDTGNHDKVEFEIIYSCYYFGLENRISKLNNYGFDTHELSMIKTSLLNLTNDVIDTKDGLYKKDLEKIQILKNKFDDIVNSNLPLIDKIYWLIQDVKRYGTLPFAGIARAGFIAVQILRSLVDEKVISQEGYNDYLNSLNTVSKQLSKDINTLSKDNFLNLYGHLRPGTYDILSLRYDEAYDEYFGNQHAPSNDKDIKSFSFSKEQKETVEEMILECGLNTNFDNLMTFIRESIEGRELAKFIFTKHLSKILNYVKDFGKRFGLDEEDLSYLDIQKILNLYATLDYRDVKDILEGDIEKNKEFYQYTKAIKLPSVIESSNDIYNFFLESDEANFITLKRSEAVVVIEKNIIKSNLKNKIVCIKSADPGYDYLFSKDISGLITCYGGANSHMAIRCSEMGIPAAIGCGESNFSKYIQASVIEINAEKKWIKILS